MDVLPARHFRRFWRWILSSSKLCGLLASLLACAVPIRADDYSRLPGLGGPDITPDPVLESSGGWSTYWQDPMANPRSWLFHDHWYHPSSWPTIYSELDFMPLRVDQSGGQSYLANATLQGATYQRVGVLSTNDIDPEFNPGMRILLGVALGDYYRLEGSYFGSYTWSDTAVVRHNDTGDGNLVSIFSNFGNPNGAPGLYPLPQAAFTPVSGVDNNTFGSLSLSSKMNNGEINLRRRMELPLDRVVITEASCLVGLRYMNIREDMSLLTVSDQPAANTQNSATVGTNNDMFGLQLGGTGQMLVRDMAWIDFTVKGGMLFTKSDNTVNSLIQVGGVPTAGSQTASEDGTAFIGDLSLQFNYQFAPSWTARAGYNAMWLSGVALASRNLSGDPNALLFGPGTVDHDGNVVYHGPNIGLIWAR